MQINNMLTRYFVYSSINFLYFSVFWVIAYYLLKFTGLAL